MSVVPDIYGNVNGQNTFAGPVPNGYNQSLFTSLGRLVPNSQVGATNGSILGASTGPANNNIQTSAPQGPNIQSQEDALKSSIGNAWDTYTNSLNDTANTFLPQQSQAQQDIVNSQLTQGQNTINSQKASSLRDIANNTRNAFQAGNIYLGTRGAGDSSAADQYSFAVNQQAAKQGSQLNEFVNTQLNTLQSQHDQQISSIANWLSQQQEAVKQQIASGQLNKAQDINSLSQNLLNQAIAAKNQVTQNAQNQYNALMSWAANNSHNLGTLQSNIAGIPHALGNVQVDSSGNIAQAPIPFGGGTTNNQNGLFG